MQSSPLPCYLIPLIELVANNIIFTLVFIKFIIIVTNSVFISLLSYSLFYAYDDCINLKVYHFCYG
jgi:positive regulator of sigma E activity